MNTFDIVRTIKAKFPWVDSIEFRPGYAAEVEGPMKPDWFMFIRGNLMGDRLTVVSAFTEELLLRCPDDDAIAQLFVEQIGADVDDAIKRKG